MNCKPGDLAIIKRGSVAGRIVEILYGCPKNVVFHLPDGHPHKAVNHDWVVMFQNPVEAPLENGSHRMALYCSAPDSALVPIRGDLLEDELSIKENMPEALKLALGITAKDWI